MYTPAPVPPLPAGADRPAEKLIGKQEGMFKAVLDHFSSADYKVPGDKPSELTEIERFWLVRACSYEG